MYSEKKTLRLSCALQDTVEQLRARCDELSAREQVYAASWKKDSDVRQQMSLEVNSLQVVLEQKNDEIRRLRQRQSDLETKVCYAMGQTPAIRLAADLFPGYYSINVKNLNSLKLGVRTTW